MAKKSYIGTLFQVKPFKVWNLQYYIKGADGQRIRKRESLGTENKVEAIKRATEKTEPLKLKSRLDKDETFFQDRIASTRTEADRINKERTRIPLSEAWKRFPYEVRTRGGVEKPLADRVKKMYASLWQSFVDWCGDNRPALQYLEQVAPADCQAYAVHCKRAGGLRGAAVGPAGLNLRIIVCRVVCDLAGISPNPFAGWSDQNKKGLRKQDENKEHHNALEVSELQRVIASAQGEYRLAIIIGVHTGLRLKDAINLRWENIWDGMIHKTTAKTGEPVELAIFPFLAYELSTLTRPKSGKGYILPELATLYARDPTAISKQIRRLFESCDIEVVEKMKGRAKAVSRRGFHSLRTTFITYCAQDGIPTAEIAEWCGHSPEVNRIYQDMKRRSKERNEKFLNVRQFKKLASIPETAEHPAIMPEFREIPNAQTDLLAMVEKMDETTAALWLAKMKEG